MANGVPAYRPSPSAAPSWPPPPHDPRERVCIAAWEGWEVRDFPTGDPRRDYLARHGMAHLQLWHPSAGVSVLTPSRLTADQLEVFPIDGWKRAASDSQAAAALVRGAFHLALPGPARLRALSRWFGAKKS